MPKPLFDSTRRLWFNARRESDFKATLVSDVRAMHVIPVETPRDVFLGNQARVSGKYRMTPVGGRQLLTEMSSGLYQMLRTIESSEQDNHSSDRLAKFAADIVNRVAVIRERQIIGKKLICCGDRSQLDGFVGAKYRLVTNHTIFDMLLESCGTMRGKPRFFLGELLGREMTAVLISEKPLKGKVHSGIVLQNSETSGRAIRVAVVLYDRDTKLWSASPFTRDTRIPHLRSKLIRDRMHMLPEHLDKQHKKLERGIDQYFQAANELLVREASEAVLFRLRARLTSRATAFGVSATDLNDAMEAFGSSVIEKRLRPTVGRLYATFCQSADNKPAGRSIGLRQLAFSTVFNEE